MEINPFEVTLWFILIVLFVIFILFILDVPSAPLDLDIKKGPTVDVTWSKPTSEGGEPITGYVIEYRVKGTPTWIEDGRPTELAWSFTNFEVGESYEVRCAAFNDIGTGEYAQYPSLISISSSAKALFSSALLALFASPLLI